ncbi:TetR/AcrR family transcriptional regulator [Planomonospora venezuelensis]|uniref:AcrR family transcriptional regulator n=1 Tax=Planomonospora venezuelensis TaxID=1999 RepID=A0A841DFK2_PLAVE|nr:TetR/AcrR family transcriptional regulator [Planomonospora venezuelensis]MBB5966865.1 AcrR family transcriptional regulator [Planomonospora venezuelensis]GIN03865.1 TetR family transcriptional regulator [Planomonospora venezuelensis]
MTEAPIRRPGGRSARVRAAVLDATLAELTGEGYDGLTAESVADRSGVHKATLYRRWGGVDGLVADVLSRAAGQPWQVPDTGSLRDDLHAITQAVRAGFTDPDGGAAPRNLILAALRSPQGREALTGLFEARHGLAAGVVTRAVARGEVPEGTDAVDVVRATCAPLYYRLFVTGEPLDGPAARRAAEVALAAARAGAFAPPP